MLLKCAAQPLQLVLGKESFQLLVETPLVPFVRYSGGKREAVQREFLDVFKVDSPLVLFSFCIGK
jgi:hypothetical protein